jgi:hypothetical protein
MWFERLTGFPEISPQQVRLNLVVDGDLLKSLVNGQEMACGQLETPSLSELRARVRSLLGSTQPSSQQVIGRISVREVIADVQSLHIDRSNAGALFQVASQFNLLEMVNPQVTPEQGVGIYEQDRTQGPACAIAAGAGTIYRNYFALVNGQIGQSARHQIDCLADIGTALGNTKNCLWEMKNGYALASQEGLLEINNRLQSASEQELDELRQLLRVGIQWQTQVTLSASQHQVSQVYCSALPVAYSPHPADLWQGFARLILEAAYEATICVAILNAHHTGNHQLFLTLLGGGAFGNENSWIVNSIQRALHLYQSNDLDVAIVSYRMTQPCVQPLIDRFPRI